MTTIHGARLRDVHTRLTADGGTVVVALFELPRGNYHIPSDAGNLWTLTQETAGPVMVTSSMCPGCGQNRVLRNYGTPGTPYFVPHHTAHNGVDGPLCKQTGVEAP